MAFLHCADRWSVFWRISLSIEPDATVSLSEALLFSPEESRHELWRDELWNRFFTGAPRRQRQAVEEIQHIQASLRERAAKYDDDMRRSVRTACIEACDHIKSEGVFQGRKAR